MRLRTAAHPRSSTTGGPPARAARRWRAAALVAVAGLAVLLATGAERDSHPPRGSETAAVTSARPGVEQVEPLGGKLYPPRYDTLDYRLNQLVARHEGRDVAPGTPAMDGDALVAVVVLLAPARAGDVVAYLRENGVALPTPATGAEFLAATMPIALLPGLAGRPGVQRVTVEPEIQRFGGEGIAPHGADFWHDPGWTGSGVKIGIIDAGFVSYPTGITRGHLPTPAGVWCIVGSNPFAPDTPPLTVTHDLGDCVSGHALTIDFHGTWVTELVYDIAPEADYYIARVARHSDVRTAVTWMIAQGVDVINMSLGTGWEGPGDGTSPYDVAWISQVARAVDNGIFVTIPSGNSELGSWFGPFRDSDGDNIMEWDENGDECNFVELAGGLLLHVRWDDTWNGANDDLDFYIKSGSSTGANIALSEESQTGGTGHDPYESISAFFARDPSFAGDLQRGSYCLVITREAGVTTDWVQLIIDGDLPDSSPEHWTVGYSLTSPSETTKEGVVTVGAASVSSTGSIQPTSSRGPIPESAVTKPDIVGLDGVRFDTYAGTRIEGTSLAAPHVAGLAALVKQRNPDYTPAQIATYLKDNALPRGEPDPNNTWGHGLAFLPHIGPVITGDPRIGAELTANTTAVDDIDGIPASPTYTYQWIRVSSDGTETNISSATSATYTPVQADVGKTLKVKVSFQDSATTPNDEEQKSVASLRVVPLASANRAATGAPTISGTLRVAETLPASTSAIRDADGLTGVTYEYQWVRVDGGTDTNISGAEGQTYVLQEVDQGKKVKVKVTFGDDYRNAEERESAETDTIGVKANIPPAFPSDEDGVREVVETRGGEAHVAQDIGAPFAATDPDGDTLTYSIKDGSDLFEIASNGQLRTKAAVDYEIPTSHRHTIVVQVTDSKDIDGVADTVIDDMIDVTITVINVDDPPVISGLQTVDWPENAAGTIATYGASDPEGVVTLLDLTDTGDHESFDLSQNGLSYRLSFKSTALPDFEGKQQYHIELGATTDLFATVYETMYAVTINITDVDEPPEITFKEGSNVTANDNALTVDENHDGGLATFSADDPESTPGLTYQWSVVGTDGGDFAFTAEADTRSGELSFAANPDYERPADSVGNNVYDITVSALDSDGETGSIAVTVTVVDVNEPPTISGKTEVSLNEVVNPTTGQVVRVDTYTKSDPDRPSQTTNWGPLGSTTVLSGANAEVFDFDLPTGALTFKRPPDYENGGGTYQVTLTANDGAAAGTLDVTVTVANVEETGTLTLGAGLGVNGEALVATLTDPDGVATQTWVWQRRTGTSGSWTDIDNTNASSYTPTAADVGEYLRARVTYTDGAGTNDTTLTKATELPTLNDASSNQPPTPPDPLPQVADVPEDAPAGRNVVQVVFTDPEGEQQLTYSLSGSDEFAIGSGSGRITVKSGELNYEETTSYLVTVSAADSYGSAGMVMLTIGISDVDEPPEITLASAAGVDVTVDGNAVSVDENHAGDLVEVTATDPETTHTDYTLVLAGTHSTSFTLNTGVLSFTNPPDHEAREVYRLTLTASNASESSTLDVTVTVRDVNEPPNIIGMAEFTVNEGHTGLLRTYQTSDPDRPAQTTNWGPVGSSEVLSGTHSDSFVFDLQSGRLTFASPPDYENGGGRYRVTLTANDGAAAGSLDITVNVANLEEQGELTFEGGVTQGANGVPLQATLTDPDGVATQTWVWQRRTGTSGSWTDIDNTNASSYTPTADDVGEYLRARVTYTDGTGPDETTLTADTEFPTVNDASSNQPPTPPALLPQVDAIPENASAGRNVVRVVFTDPENERLTYSLDGSDEFAINSRTGQITVKSGGLDYENTPIHNNIRSHEVTVRAADPIGADATVTLMVEVVDVNEAPTAADLAVTILEDEDVNIDVVEMASDEDAGDTLTVARVVRSPRPGTATVNVGTNNITYTPAVNYHGADSFTYRVKDANNLPSNTARVSITVVSVNDAPVFPAATTARSVSESAAEGDSVGAAVTATDIDGDTPTYSLSGTGAFAFEIDPGSGQITVRAGATFVPQDTYDVTVEANDGSGEANNRAIIAVTITVVAGPVAPPSSGGGGGFGGGGFGGGGGGGGGGPSGPVPSEADFEWTVERDIEALDGGHDKPSGQWSDGATLWVLENGDGADDAVYAYDLESGERVEGREFELDETNRAPRGVWSDRTVLWVSDSGRNSLFAHDLATGERLPERDLALAERNRAARGIWSDDEAMFVLDGGKDSLFAYDLASGELLAEYALDPTNDDPHGIWSDGVTVWVSNHDPKHLFAYRLPAPEGPAAEDAERQALERVSAEEFGELSNASNNSPRGIWSDGEVMYVADESDGKVYSYNMPDAINARLASLTLSGVDFGEFDPGTTEYEGAAGEGVTETTVEAVPAQSGASVAIDPPDSDGEAEGHQVSLDGAEVTVTVTSPDGSRTRVYRVALEAPPVELALTPAWTAIDWPGAGGVAITEAGLPDAVVAVYRWDEATGAWLTFFPGLGDVPGLNNLNTLSTGATYWVAVSEPVTWTVAPASVP